jgi:hypothetical protein
MARITDCGEQLIERARVHDASKFSPECQRALKTSHLGALQTQPF